MNLPAEETERFYRIWFALLHYVNTQRRLVPAFPPDPKRARISPADATAVRDALWADEALREAFIAENPPGLPADDLALVASWQHRLAGNFLVIRYLKKHTAFLTTTEPARVYGVLGLVSPIEEILGPYLPVYVKAVLLPWEGRIIYDSLMLPYNVHFGSGMRRGFNESYRNAQEREGIITTLGPSHMPADPGAARKEVARRNTKLLGAFRRELGRSGLSPKMIELHSGNIASFAESLLAQDPPRGLLELTEADLRAFLERGGASANLVSFKRFVRFLLVTERIDYEVGESLHEFLKQAGR